MKSTAIILSAGQGKRMNCPTAKQYLELKGKPVLYYSLAAFQAAPEIDQMVVVANENDHIFIKNELALKHGFDKITDIIAGGSERYHSVYNGLDTQAASESDFVFIHDSARPLIDCEIISRAAAAVLDHPAIVVGMPVKDTIKRVDSADMVCETINRETLWAVQTPQVFAASLIKMAYERLMLKEQTEGLSGFSITDDAMAVEIFTEIKVKLIHGFDHNIKITTPGDLQAAASFMI